MSAREHTLAGVGLLWLRVLMGLGIASHGYAKVFGGRVTMLTSSVESLGFPAPVVFAWAAALSEFVGGLLIAAGIQTRIAAGFVFATMSVAAFVAHAADPFSKKELALAYWTMAGALMLLGSGPYSVGALLKRPVR